jgi:protease secretion system outer membrane protein
MKATLRIRPVDLQRKGGLPSAPVGWAVALLLAVGMSPVQAQSFRESMRAAERADAQFAAALAAVSNRKVQGQEAKAAFYPSASVSYGRSDLSAGSAGAGYGLTVTQPLLNYDRYLTLQQADPTAVLALVEERQARAELSLRVFKAMAEIIRSREGIRALEVQIEGLDTQVKRARRMRELGQGTITEVSDFEVRLAVAEANMINQRSALEAAQRTFSLLTGLRSDPQQISVVDAAEAPAVGEAEFVARVRDGANSVVSSRQSIRLQEIAVKRVRADFVPQLTAVASTGRAAGSANNSSDTRVGITFNAPLGASQWYGNQKAATELLRAQESFRFAQESATSDALRLLRSAAALTSEVAIRKRAVDSARLALEGNIKSYQGGVKSNIDVVTSYQNLTDTEVALANSEILRVEALLNLKLLDPASAP